MSIATIKQNIKGILDDLVTDEVIAGATITDIKKNPLDADIPTFPHAFLMPPAVEGEVLDNRYVTRTYTFDIMVLFKAENLSSTTEVETTIEGMLNKFDNDPTCGGAAAGGMPPSSSSPVPFQHNHQQLIMVVLQVQATETVLLTFA